IAIEALSWRIVTSAPATTVDTQALAPSGQTEEHPSSRREVADADGMTTRRWPVYRWSELPTAKKISGPALIEDPYTTIVVPSLFEFEMDQRHCIHMRQTETHHGNA